MKIHIRQGGEYMSDKALLGAADIAEILGVSKSKAYTIIREGNQELS